MLTKSLPLDFADQSLLKRTAVPPPALNVQILDTLASPGLFVLVKWIALALKSPPTEPQRKVVLVSAGLDAMGWEGLLRKHGVPFASVITNNSLEFVTPTAQSSLSSDRKSLAPLVASIASAIANSHGEPPLLVIDDLSSLLWSGYPVREVERFYTSSRSLQAQSSCTLVILSHCDLTSVAQPQNSTLHEADDERLVRKLILHADVVIKTRSLGVANAGEITIHRGAAHLKDPELPTTFEDATIQYRIDDVNVDFVMKGHDRGFL